MLIPLRHELGRFNMLVLENSTWLQRHVIGIVGVRGCQLHTHSVAACPPNLARKNLMMGPDNEPINQSSTHKGIRTKQPKNRSCSLGKNGAIDVDACFPLGESICRAGSELFIRIRNPIHATKRNRPPA